MMAQLLGTTAIASDWQAIRELLNTNLQIIQQSSIKQFELVMEPSFKSTVFNYIADPIINQWLKHIKSSKSTDDLSKYNLQVGLRAIKKSIDDYVYLDLEHTPQEAENLFKRLHDPTFWAKYIQYPR